MKSFPAYDTDDAFTFQVTRASSWEHLGYRVDRLSHRSIIPSNYTFEMERKKKSNIYMRLIDEDVPVSHVWGWRIMTAEGGEG